MESGQRRGQRRSVEGGSGERGWSHMNAEEWGKLSTSWGRRMLSERRDEARKAADTADSGPRLGSTGLFESASLFFFLKKTI